MRCSRLLSALAALVVVTGCTGSPVTLVSSAPPAPSSTPASPSVPAGVNDVALRSVREAVERERGRAVSLTSGESGWQLMVYLGATEISYSVDPATGELSNRVVDAADPMTAEAIETAKISLADAVERALRATPGRLVSASLDAAEGGSARWDVHIVAAGGETVQLTVDPATGEVER